MEDSCGICIYRKLLYTERYDCFDVEVYQCRISGKILDTFTVDNHCCNKFSAEDWVST